MLGTLHPVSTKYEFDSQEYLAEYMEGWSWEMPKGTKVHKCVEKVKKTGGVNPYAVCQSSTGQSYKTGKKLPLTRHGRGRG